jgi:tetratricopeptide (TPR) repeat protein
LLRHGRASYQERARSGYARRVSRSLGIAAALIALVLAVFAQVRDHEFVHYDDDYYITGNEKLHEGLSFETLRYWLVTPFATNWTPLSSISMQFDYELYGTEPRGWLLTNAALHAASTALLFAALRRLTGATWRSAFVAAVFAVHPLHVESVAWASERKDVLSGLCFVLGLLAYARYAERQSALRYALLVAAQALGLLAKPTLVTLPCVLLLLDYWPLGRWQRGAAKRVVSEKLPLFALAAAASAVTYWVQQDQGAMPTQAPPFVERVQNALEAYVAYLSQSFWPTKLACFYPYPREAGGALVTAARAALVGGLSAAALLLAKRRGYFFVGWFWFVGMLVPMIGLVQVGLQGRADRYTYLPQIGLAIALAWGAHELALRRPRLRAPVAALAAFAVAGLALAAERQVGVWRDTLTLFTHAADVTEGNYLAWKVIGDERAKLGQTAAAEAAYQRSIELKADYAESHYEYAMLLLERGEQTQALRHLVWIAQSNPNHERVYDALGALLLERGAFEEAIAPLTRALAQKRAREPEHRAWLLGLLATAEAALGKRDLAAAHYRESLAAKPDHTPAALNLALLLAGDPALGSIAEAEALIERSLVREAGGDTRQLRYAQAVVAWAAGQRDRARAIARSVVADSESSGDAELAARTRSLLASFERESRRTGRAEPTQR